MMRRMPAARKSRRARKAAKRRNGSFASPLTRGSARCAPSPGAAATSRPPRRAIRTPCAAPTTPWLTSRRWPSGTIPPPLRPTTPCAPLPVPSPWRRSRWWSSSRRPTAWATTFSANGTVPSAATATRHPCSCPGTKSTSIRPSPTTAGRSGSRSQPTNWSSGKFTAARWRRYSGTARSAARWSRTTRCLPNIPPPLRRPSSTPGAPCSPRPTWRPCAWTAASLRRAARS